MDRSGTQVSYSIRLRMGYFRGHHRSTRSLPQSPPIESLAEGQQSRGKGRRRIRGPVFNPPFGKGLPACLGGLLGAADNVVQDSQGDQEEQKSHGVVFFPAECAAGRSRMALYQRRNTPLFLSAVMPVSFTDSAVLAAENLPAGTQPRPHIVSHLVEIAAGRIRPQTAAEALHGGFNLKAERCVGVHKRGA